MHRLLFLLFLLFFSKGDAVLYEYFDTDRLIECEFSSVFQNRIRFEEGRILKFLVPDKDVEVRIEENTGQVFVYLRNRVIEKTTISLVTESGIQDVEICFVEKPSETLVLKQFEKVIYKNQKSPKSNQTGAIELLKCIIEGKIPKGYTSFSVESQETFLSRKRNISIRQVSEMIGPNGTLKIFSVKNFSKRSVCLEESVFSVLGGRWIYIDERSLKPKNRTLLVIGDL